MIRLWGFQVGKLSVCWYDLWSGHFGFEVAWGGRILIDWFGP